VGARIQQFALWIKIQSEAKERVFIIKCARARAACSPALFYISSFPRRCPGNVSRGARVICVRMPMYGSALVPKKSLDVIATFFSTHRIAIVPLCFIRERAHPHFGMHVHSWKRIIPRLRFRISLFAQLERFFTCENARCWPFCKLQLNVCIAHGSLGEYYWRQRLLWK